jgi:hypothetical protein
MIYNCTFKKKMIYNCNTKNNNTNFAYTYSIYKFLLINEYFFKKTSYKKNENVLALFLSKMFWQSYVTKFNFLDYLRFDLSSITSVLGSGYVDALVLFVSLFVSGLLRSAGLKSRVYLHRFAQKSFYARC